MSQADRIPTSAALLAIATVSLGAVALALVTQHVFDMQPCHGACCSGWSSS